jgi:dTDP-4-dehydrorhamnose 3,5-epimerase
MIIQKLEIDGSWIASSPEVSDSRGSFREWFKASDFELATGRKFQVLQSNISISQCGAIRGIHYSLSPQGQGKWITCITGSIWDVIVDIRPSSPTFKKWIPILLSENSGTSVFISEGLGHGFLALEDNSAVSYLLTTEYSPNEEFGINPFDSELQISWPTSLPLLSRKDSEAKSLHTLMLEEKLPNLIL